MPNVDFAALKGWLLGTVWGVIILGAIGSVIGSILWVLIRRLSRRLVGSWYRLLFALAYTRFGRHIEIGEKLRAQYAEESKAQRYMVHVVVTAANTLFESMLATAAVLGTIAIAVVYGIHRPLLLVVAISITVPLVLQCIRSGVYLICFVDQSIQDMEERIESSQPKRYRDYAAARLAERAKASSQAMQRTAPRSDA
jgi:hypothetical protein